MMNYIDKKLVSFLFFVSVFFMLQGCGKMAVVSNVEILGTSDSLVLETDTFDLRKSKPNPHPYTSDLKLHNYSIKVVLRLVNMFPIFSKNENWMKKWFVGISDRPLNMVL